MGKCPGQQLLSGTKEKKKTVQDPGIKIMRLKTTLLTKKGKQRNELNKHILDSGSGTETTLEDQLVKYLDIDQGTNLMLIID